MLVFGNILEPCAGNRFGGCIRWVGGTSRQAQPAATSEEETRPIPRPIYPLPC